MNESTSSFLPFVLSLMFARWVESNFVQNQCSFFSF